jgi:predicted dehydrogenase
MARTGPLRIGILGCAAIARQFARDVAPSDAVRIVAVGSRRADTAADFARAFGIGRAHASYDALVADPEVDAVYLPLPNSMHAEWAVRAAEQRKHVLCEKPLALGEDEARAMYAAAQRHGIILLESFPYRHQPGIAALERLLADGAIGEVRSMQATFCFTAGNLDTNIRMKPELGGGALLDAGSYPLSLIRLVMGCAPRRVQADATWAATGVDIAMMATLHYADGRRAQLSCAMNSAYHRHASIEGTHGVIETDYLNHTSEQAGGNAHGYLPGRLLVRRGTATSVPLEEVRAPVGSGFLFAAEAFARLVAARDFAAAARLAGESIDNAVTLEALARSARLGQAVEPKAVR